jgi:hypothetical protein
MIKDIYKRVNNNCNDPIRLAKLEGYEIEEQSPERQPLMT